MGLKPGQIWRDVQDSKLGTKRYGRPVESADFEIIDVSVSSSLRNKQRTRVRYLWSRRLSVIDTDRICPPKYTLIKDA